MICRSLLWLLLLSQLSIGVLGARAAEVSIATSSDLFLYTVASPVFDSHQAMISNDISCENAENVQPRKALCLVPPIYLLRPLILASRSSEVAFPKNVIEAASLLKSGKKPLFAQISC